MPVCEFVNCLSGSRKNKILKPPTLHRFPKNVHFRHLWQLQSQTGFNPKSINFDTGVVCSLHFALYHYDSKGKQKSARNLKKDAIPLNNNGLDYYDIPYRRTFTPHLSPIKTPTGLFSVFDDIVEYCHKLCCIRLFDSSTIDNDFGVKLLDSDNKDELIMR